MRITGTESEGGSRLLPLLVVVAAVVALAGLASVRDGAAPRVESAAEATP